jgi:hypothetical protein|nr:MAG TPA: hypothetical protein [Caudoviricetes sp.]
MDMDILKLVQELTVRAVESETQLDAIWRLCCREQVSQARHCKDIGYSTVSVSDIRAITGWEDSGEALSILSELKGKEGEE